MKTTDNFYCAPEQVLNGCLTSVPAAVAVVAMDDHGRITVYGSHSTPVVLSMLKQASREVIGFQNIPDEEA